MSLFRNRSQLFFTGGPTYTVGSTVLNPEHYLYNYLYAAYIPVGFNDRGQSYIGLISNQFPTFTSGTANTQVNAAGIGFTMSNTSGQVLKSGNQSVFGGLSSVTVISRWKSGTSSHGAGANVVRKDGEFTPIQFGFAGTIDKLGCTVWANSTTFSSGFNLTSIPNNAIVDTATVYTGSNIRFYQRLNEGTVEAGANTGTTGTSITVNSGTPLCFGGNESGTELMSSGDALNYVLFFNIALTQEQVTSLWSDAPLSLLTSNEGDVMTMFSAGGGIGGGGTGGQAGGTFTLMGVG